MSTITVDIATSNDVVVSYMNKKITIMNGLIRDEECFYMRCSADVLNLVVNEGFES